LLLELSPKVPPGGLRAGHERHVRSLDGCAARKRSSEQSAFKLPSVEEGMPEIGQLRFAPRLLNRASHKQ
jgi:hypothetical protein